MLQFDTKQRCRVAPCVRRAQSIHIPAEKHASNIDLKGSLVVVSARKEILIVDWRERCGLSLSLTPNQNPGHVEQNMGEVCLYTSRRPIFNVDVHAER